MGEKVKGFRKKSFLLVIIYSWIFPGQGNSQNRLNFNQSIYTITVDNPAFIGFEDFLDITTGYKVQWKGFNEGPRAYFLQANWAFSRTTNKSYNKRSLRLHNIREYYRQESSRQFIVRKNNRHGVGLTMKNEQLGIFEFFALKIGYAYHMRLSKTLNLSGGMNLGINQGKIDGTKVSVTDPNDAIYLQYAGEIITENKMNLDIGYVVYGKQFFAGYTMGDVFKSKLTFGNAFGESLNNVEHRFVVGRKSYIHPSFTLLTMINVNLARNQAISYRATGLLKYVNVGWIGLNTNYPYDLSAFLGINISKYLAVSYTYDILTSSEKVLGHSSQEVFLSLRLIHKKDHHPYF